MTCPSCPICVNDQHHLAGCTAHVVQVFPLRSATCTLCAFRQSGMPMSKIPPMVIVRWRIWLCVELPTSVMRSPTVTSIASASPLPMKSTSWSSGCQVLPRFDVLGDRPRPAAPSLARCRRCETAKAPSRLLASPPVLMRRVAATTCGWDRGSFHDHHFIWQRQQRSLVGFIVVALRRASGCSRPAL